MVLFFRLLKVPELKQSSLASSRYIDRIISTGNISLKYLRKIHTKPACLPVLKKFNGSMNPESMNKTWIHILLW